MGNWRRCPHMNLRGIYGDEINHSMGKRLQCRDCGRLLDGPVSLAAHDAEVEAKALRDAADEFEAAARAGIEPALNLLAAKLLRRRAERPQEVATIAGTP